MFKWSEELLLKLEVGQFSFLQELHGKLTKRVSYKEGDIFSGKTANLVGEKERERETYFISFIPADRLPSIYMYITEITIIPEIQVGRY